MARLIGELMQVFGVATDQPNKSAACCLVDPKNSSSSSFDDNKAAAVVAADDEFMIRALTCVFGMEKDGKIKKDRARQVVEKLYGEEEGMIPGELEEEEVVAAEEVMSGLMEEEEEGSRKRQELLEEAFRIFDENGNGFIEANELKRVLQCLGLDKGWDLSDIEKMMKVVDLNLDGKVDFHEFQLMMMMS